MRAWRSWSASCWAGRPEGASRSSAALAEGLCAAVAAAQHARLARCQEAWQQQEVSQLLAGQPDLCSSSVASRRNASAHCNGALAAAGVTRKADEMVCVGCGSSGRVDCCKGFQAAAAAGLWSYALV
uniref:Uncharacterized protein n=1 Tax=Tetradesmus obliquus TaxID=3088 RepID=A0A383WF57_TETOB|eukprot:jgi/Sobl393_1/2279/SZX75376.1